MTRTQPPPPPPELDLYIEALGLEDTLRLIETYGGRKLYVAKNITNHSVPLMEDLEEKLGKATAKKLVELCGGVAVTVPLCGGWRTQLYFQRGMSMVEIAKKLGCHYDTVWRRLKKAAHDDGPYSWRV